MNMAETENLVAAGLRGELREREPMARHVSWRAGGAAERAYVPADLGDLAAFLRALPHAEPVHFVGLGSNLLVRDGGLRGTVILTHRALRGIRIERDGGALAMNAGCFGGETWGIVTEVNTVDRNGALHQRKPGDYEIGYRHVRLKAAGGKRQPEEWFVAAGLRLAPGSRKESLNKIKQLLSKRLSTQPLDEPNAGSVFRNPEGDHAARLIEACGLKGHAIGGARISAKHANFIVNPGGARAADIEALIELAERNVKEKFGIALEREVRIVGDA